MSARCFRVREPSLAQTTTVALRYRTAGGSRDGLNRNMMWRDIESQITRSSGIERRSSHGAFLTLKRLLAATVLLVMAPIAAAHAQGVEGIRSVTLFVGTGAQPGRQRDQ